MYLLRIKQQGINEYGKLVETNGDLGTGSTKKSELLVTDDRVMEVYRADEQAQEEYYKNVGFLC